MNKRLISLMLLSSLLLAGCDSSDTPGDTTQDTAGTTTAPEDTGLTDHVPELNFNGAEFRTIEQESTVNSFYAEESTGDIVIDTIYNRNRSMEERFNVTFTETRRENYKDITTLVNNAVMSGSDEFDLIFGQMFATASNATTGVYADWNQVPYVNFSNPWYTKSIQDASVGSKLYMIESDLCVMYTEQTWLMVYNQTKAEEFNLPNLYQLVRDGKWTLDQFNTIISSMYTDVNGNTKRDDGDFFGFAANQDGCQVAAFVYGCDARLVNVADDLSLTHTIADEKSIDVLTKLANLFNVNDGSVHKSSDSVSMSVHERRKLFCNSIVMFAPLQVSDLVASDMREFNDSYGVLPIPKYDENQEEYFTVVDGGANIMTIPATATEEQLKMVGALVEAMSAASYNDVTTVYCEQALEQKGTRDEDSMEMLRMILDSRVIDFAYLYGASGWVMQLPTLVSNSDAIVSTIESKKNTMDEYYKSVIEYCTSEE